MHDEGKNELLVHPSRAFKLVDIVKLFVALPTNQSSYVLLPAKYGKNITWHGNAFRWHLTARASLPS